MRFYQYLPWLDRDNISVEMQPLLSDEMLQARYASGRYGLQPLLQAYLRRVAILFSRRKFDLLWIEKEALQWWPLWIERLLLSGIPYVLDYDDAVFHQYDLHPSYWIRKFYGQRLDGLMAGAGLVVAGNGYLEKRARLAGARQVEIIPTVIDLERYAPIVSNDFLPYGPNSLPLIVWIGSPSTLAYLKGISGALRSLAERVPFALRIVGAGPTEFPGVNTELFDWSEESEADLIRSAQIGVMPLDDTPWAKGKCGYKLIQYMACGLPVVASPVGVNCDIVSPGKTGFLASTADEWVSALETLLKDSALCQKMGHAGREQVKAHYCIQQTGPKLASLLRETASRAECV